MLFRSCLFQHVVAELDIGVHPFQTGVFLLQLFHPRHQRGVHATILRPPLVKCDTAHTVLTAKLAYEDSILSLFQNCQNLAVGKAGRFHAKSPGSSVSEIILINATFFWRYCHAILFRIKSVRIRFHFFLQFHVHRLEFSLIISY